MSEGNVCGDWFSDVGWGRVIRLSEVGDVTSRERYESFADWCEQIPEGSFLTLATTFDTEQGKADILVAGVGKGCVDFVAAGVSVVDANGFEDHYFSVRDPDTVISFTYDPEEAEK